MRNFHRGYAAVMYVSITALIVISVLIFVRNLNRGGKDQESTLTQLINGHNPGQAAIQEFLANDKHPSLTFSGQRLDLAAKQLTGSLKFELPLGAESELFDQTAGTKVFSCNSDATSCNLKPQYAKDQVQLQLVTASSEAGSEFEFVKNVPLSAIDQSILKRVTYPITVPVTGFPDLYPQDRYFYDLLMSFVLPNGIVRLVNGKDASTLPDSSEDADKYVFDPGNVAESETVATRPLVDAKGKPVAGEFHISFTRPSTDQLYIYAVALIPLLFALLFLHLLFFSRQFHAKVFEEFTEALIVAILAVLPLRVVLVPASLEGLTRVDIVLGIGLVLIVAVAIGKYATEIWYTGRQAPMHEAVEVHATEGHQPPTAEPATEPVV